jgi:two-component system, NtrC family, sensor kinase
MASLGELSAVIAHEIQSPLNKEYIGLANHGFRARDKDFNATIELETDPNAGTVNMVVSDMGRVLLNLLN